MNNSACESRLTYYKEAKDYQYFGEALLSAAGEGRLGFDNINGTSTHEVLWQLGIALTMTRDQIIICLSRLTGRHPHIVAYLTDGCSLSSTRSQLARVIDSAICYTEQDVPEGHKMEIAEAFV